MRIGQFGLLFASANGQLSARSLGRHLILACALLPLLPTGGGCRGHHPIVGRRRLPDRNDPQLVERVSREFSSCRLERTCGQLIGVDCQSASDGPYFYIEVNTFKHIASCGGNCMNGPCPDCPPPQWDCEVY